MKGKEKCKILKQIRQKIAEQNDITYVTSECKHKGGCTGTCPKCEQELRYLEKELEKRKRAGKSIAVAGIATALMVASVGCGNGDSTATAQTEQPYTTQETATAGVPSPTWVEWMGEPTAPAPTGAICEELTEATELGEVPLMGDVAYEETGP